MATKTNSKTKAGKFNFQFKLVLAGVVTYVVSMAFAYGIIFYLNSINTNFFSNDFYATINGGGSAAVDLLMEFANMNAISGFIGGVALMSLLVLIVFAEWFNFHKIESYKNATIWGLIWASLFLCLDRMIDYLYTAVMMVVSPNGYSSIGVLSNSFGPYYLILLVFVALMPAFLLTIHKLNVKFGK